MTRCVGAIAHLLQLQLSLEREPGSPETRTQIVAANHHITTRTQQAETPKSGNMSLFGVGPIALLNIWVPTALQTFYSTRQWSWILLFCKCQWSWISPPGRCNSILQTRARKPPASDGGKGLSRRRPARSECARRAKWKLSGTLQNPGFSPLLARGGVCVFFLREDWI